MTSTFSKWKTTQYFRKWKTFLSIFYFAPYEGDIFSNDYSINRSINLVCKSNPRDLYKSMVYIWVSVGLTITFDPNAVITSILLVLNLHAVMMSGPILQPAPPLQLHVVHCVLVHKLNNCWQRRRNRLAHIYFLQAEKKKNPTVWFLIS